MQSFWPPAQIFGGKLVQKVSRNLDFCLGDVSAGGKWYQTISPGGWQGLFFGTGRKGSDLIRDSPLRYQTKSSAAWKSCLSDKRSLLEWKYPTAIPFRLRLWWRKQPQEVSVKCWGPTSQILAFTCFDIGESMGSASKWGGNFNFSSFSENAATANVPAPQTFVGKPGEKRRGCSTRNIILWCASLEREAQVVKRDPCCTSIESAQKGLASQGRGPTRSPCFASWNNGYDWLAPSGRNYITVMITLLWRENTDYKDTLLKSKIWCELNCRFRNWTKKPDMLLSISFAKSHCHVSIWAHGSEQKYKKWWVNQTDEADLNYAEYSKSDPPSWSIRPIFLL